MVGCGTNIMKKHPTIKKVLIVVLVAGFFAALASAYFFFPATATHVLKSAAAIAIQSWDDTFGDSGGGYVSEVDLVTSSTDSSTDEVWTAPPVDSGEAMRRVHRKSQAVRRLQRLRRGRLRRRRLKQEMMRCRMMPLHLRRRSVPCPFL